jgi:hypothetical protein
MYQYDIIGADLRVCPNNTQQLGEHQLDNMVGHQLGDGNVNVLGE